MVKPASQRSHPIDLALSIILLAYGFASTIIGHEPPTGVLLVAIGFVALKVV